MGSRPDRLSGGDPRRMLLPSAIAALPVLSLLRWLGERQGL